MPIGTNWQLMSSALNHPTTITVSERTRRLLESVKGTGESFDDLLIDLLEETYFDDEFYKEIEHRWATEKRIRGPAVMKKAGLV